MTTQRTDLATKAFNFVPTTLKEAQEYATIFASSGLCPEAYRGRPNDILIVWQLGKELGLEKMQALRTLGCINGMPFAYGDGQLALIRRHPDFESIKEWFEGSMKDSTLTAFCMMKRKGEEAVIREFSMEDAKLAGLWEKKGVWQLYKKRMLQHRARGICSKDTFPDALYGLMSEEEAHSVAETTRVVQVVQPKNKGIAGVEESLGIIEATNVVEVTPEVEETEPQVIHEEPTLTDQLLNLVFEKNIPSKSVEKWCKQFEVSVLADIPDEGKEKIINHIKEKK